MKDYAEAMLVFKRMVGILHRIHDDDSLAFAKALDKLGFAASMSSKSNLDWAILTLRESLHLRLIHLGPHHIDTVDSLNNIAGIYLRMKNWSKAKDLYLDILNGMYINEWICYFL